jgi:hypothetical protein
MYLRVVIVSLLLFVAAFGAHEVMHLLLIYAVGAQGSIVARPWHLGYIDFSIWSLHAQPSQPLDVVRQSIVNFFGPFLAAIPFAALLWYVREPIAAAALIANVVILIFYAVIELGDLLLEQVWNTDASLLTTPEFNYGVPLLVILLTGLTLTAASAIRERGQSIPQ